MFFFVAGVMHVSQHASVGLSRMLHATQYKQQRHTTKISDDLANWGNMQLLAVIWLT
jgi:hypothetical protein